MSGLTDIPGILVGNASDYQGLTGCTAILCEQGAVAGADLRGSASGTSEFELFDPLHLTERIHAVVLAGGSAFGLEAASGVRRFLERKGVGFNTGFAVVPLVPCAILYDLGLGHASARPNREMGEAAAAAATNRPAAEGAVGVGTGATVGKLLGMSHAMKSGVGHATVALEGVYSGVVVAALAAVNAFGDVLDPKTGGILAGARRSPATLDFVDTARAMKSGGAAKFRGQNTTLVVVATNAALHKVQATKLAQLANIGMTRSISPVHTMVDGDLVIALSHGVQRADVTALGVAAAEAVSEAIVRAVTLAPTLGGLPGLRRR